ncbi:MAG: hypothetical protein IIU83_09840 [Fibrobacteraceae bacterium]|nr:hypothetical protein [Fibrobacteraceae bacterium]
MSNTNKHIEEFLDYYLNVEPSPDYAVLITGCWGSGKTYFIRQYLEGKGAAGKDVVKTFDWLTDCEKYAVVYVSLFGAKNREEMDKRVLEKLHPILSSEYLKSIPTAVSTIAKLLKEYSVNPALKATGAVAEIATPFLAEVLPNIIKGKRGKLKGIIVVFDDVERADMPLPELLGYLNEYVEHLHIPCILLADKDKWEEAQKCQEDKSTLHHLSSTKEKIIGKEFQIQTSFDEVWNFLARKENHPVGDRAWNIIGMYNDLIKAILRASGVNNYRALRNTLSDFQRFIGDKAKNVKMGKMFIDDKYFEHKEFAELIIADFVCYQYAFHIGLLNPREIIDYNLYKSAKYARTDETKEVKLVVEKIDDQNHLAGKIISETVEQRNSYSLFEECFKEIPRISTQPYDMMSFDPKYNSKWSDIWKKWLTGFCVDSKEIQKLMDKSIWYDAKDNFTINQIMKYHSLDDHTAENLLQEIKQKIKDKAYTNPNYVFILFNSWLLLASQGIFDYDVEKCFNKIKRYINSVSFDKVPFGGMEGTLTTDNVNVQEKQKQLWALINEKLPNKQLTQEQKYIQYFLKHADGSSFLAVCKTISERTEFPLTQLNIKKLLNLYKSENFKNNRMYFHEAIFDRMDMLYKQNELEQLDKEIKFLKEINDTVDNVMKKEPRPLLPNVLSLNNLKVLWKKLYHRFKQSELNDANV